MLTHQTQVEGYAVAVYWRDNSPVTFPYPLHSRPVHETYQFQRRAIESVGDPLRHTWPPALEKFIPAPQGLALGFLSAQKGYRSSEAGRLRLRNPRNELTHAFSLIPRKFISIYLDVYIRIDRCILFYYFRDRSPPKMR